jgi:hypothetical protein
MSMTLMMPAAVRRSLRVFVIRARSIASGVSPSPFTSGITERLPWPCGLSAAMRW